MTFIAVAVIFLCGYVARDLIGKLCLRAALNRIEVALGTRPRDEDAV